MPIAPRVLAAALVATAACASPEAGVRRATPVDAATAGVLAAEELAHPKEPSVVYGHRVEVAGDRVRFLACEAIDSCGERSVEVPVRSLVAKSLAGRVRPMRSDGTLAEETDVFRLTIREDATTSRGGAAADANRGMVIATPAKR